MPPRIVLANGFTVRLVGLLTQMGFDLLPENKHAKVRVRGLVHGFRLDAHAVLLGSQFVGTMLLVPKVKEARHRGPDYHQAAVQVLPVEVNVFSAPPFDFQIKASCGKSERGGQEGTF